MNLKDLQTLEIGLELYKRERPLGGQCSGLIDFLLRLLRTDIAREEAQRATRNERRKAKTLPPEATTGGE